MATEPPSPMFCYDDEIHPKTNMDPSLNNTGVFLGNDEENVSATTTCPWKLSRVMYETTYRFQEENAADGTSSAPFDPSRSTRQFHSSKNQTYNKRGYENSIT